ncbi:hypothetical protein jhhlp_007879 [Lomentospora prolificans]|uniref:DJ-1/PfpI domain-containing protein n=1 Tax=Lomentospora prolificans TaxID=41688 RepID=A0A2N3N0U9_9PEZI|nr:hypothetical protein jhhlp_007879 [Lomentospora prolificans]
MASSSTKKTLRIGVMMEAVQMSDIMGIDILGNLSEAYLNSVLGLDPTIEKYKDLAIPMEFFYISSSLELAFMTPSVYIKPTATYDDCPRDLDIVLTGGSYPDMRSPKAIKFIQEAWPKVRVWFTTCIGSIWIADAGVLKGKKVTTNRPAIPLGKKMHPDVEWLDQRWVIDEKPYEGEGGKGELWTAGGAGAGLDMIANYCLQNFDKEFVNTMALEGLQLEEGRSITQFYKA